MTTLELEASDKYPGNLILQNAYIAGAKSQDAYHGLERLRSFDRGREVFRSTAVILEEALFKILEVRGSYQGELFLQTQSIATIALNALEETNKP